MGVVDQAVEDGIGERRIADHGVPLGHRHLAGDDGGTAAMAVLQDLLSSDTQIYALRRHPVLRTSLRRRIG